MEKAGLVNKAQVKKGAGNLELGFLSETGLVDSTADKGCRPRRLAEQGGMYSVDFRNTQVAYLRKAAIGHVKVAGGTLSGMMVMAGAVKTWPGLPL